jgi:DNA mismatch repair protein MutS2
MLGRRTQELDTLLADLSVEKGKLATVRLEVEKERAGLAQRDAEVEKRLNEVKAEERKLIQDTRDVVVREAADLQRDIRLATAELRKVRSRESIDEAKKAVAAVQQRLKAEVWQPRVEEEHPLDSTIRPGDTVVLREANVRATVLSVSPATGQAEVQAGRVSLTLGLSGLEKVVTAPGAAKPVFIPITKQVSRPVSLHLDLRGKRADEVEPELDSYLNGASASDISEIRIIHGMATGTVRKIVREFLASHPLVKSFRPGGQGEGGDGATVVKL